MCDPHELKDSHHDYFVKCFKGWLEYFGVNDWMVDHSFMDDVDDYRAATVIHSIDNRLSEILLADSWDIKPSEYSLSKTAFHEVFELLFADLTLMASNREYNEANYDKERHRVIRLLERALFNRMWNNGYRILDLQSDAKSDDSEGQEVSEIHNNTAMPDTWVQRLKSKSRRWFDSLSPF